MKKTSGKKGFTLIELLVVSTIIAVLSAIGIASFVNAGKSARDAKRKADLETVRQALVLYRSDKGKYFKRNSGPNNNNYDLLTNQLVPDYLGEPVPQDPKDEGDYLYEYKSDESTFNLRAKLEKTNDYYNVYNP